jgi:hypothetical protein
MQFDKQQILDFLEQQGRQGEKRQAEQELPQQVDTDKPEHQNLLEKIGVSPQELITKLAGGSFGL